MKYFSDIHYTYPFYAIDGVHAYFISNAFLAQAQIMLFSKILISQKLALPYLKKGV